MLSVCNNLDIKPYLINVSCNAYYYDYTGLDPKMRQRYYSKIVDLANQHDIPTYSELRDMEYEPYVFADVMHFGMERMDLCCTGYYRAFPIKTDTCPNLKNIRMDSHIDCNSYCPNVYL